MMIYEIQLFVFFIFFFKCSIEAFPLFYKLHYLKNDFLKFECLKKYPDISSTQIDFLPLAALLRPELFDRRAVLQKREQIMQLVTESGVLKYLL